MYYFQSNVSRSTSRSLSTRDHHLGTSGRSGPFQYMPQPGMFHLPHMGGRWMGAVPPGLSYPRRDPGGGLGGTMRSSWPDARGLPPQFLSAPLKTSSALRYALCVFLVCTIWSVYSGVCVHWFCVVYGVHYLEFMCFSLLQECFNVSVCITRLVKGCGREIWLLNFMGNVFFPSLPAAYSRASSSGRGPILWPTSTGRSSSSSSSIRQVESGSGHKSISGSGSSSSSTRHSIYKRLV